MLKYFLIAIASQIRHGKSLYLLTVFGVALGVASVLSIQIINRNSLAAFEGSIEAISGEADLSVMGRLPTFPEDLYPRVLATPGVDAAWPLYRVEVALADRPRSFLQVLGFDLLASVGMPAVGSGDGGGDRWAPLRRKGWVAVSPQLADEMDWAVGDIVPVAAGSRRVDLFIGRLIDFQEISPTASTRLAVMDISQAQGLLGRPGQLHQIDVRAADGVGARMLSGRLQELLGETVRVVTPEQRTRQAEGLLSAFRLNLTAMSLISLFVGMFLVTSSTQASLVRRRPEFGLLRSLGAARLQVFALIIVEIGLLGLLGVAIGLPLGYVAARANVDVVSATLTNLYLLEEISTLQMPLWLYGLAGMVGVGGALGGAVLPALDMSRRDTRALLSSLTLHERVRSVSGQLFAAGLGILAISGSAYVLWGRGWQPSGFALGIALLIGLPLLTPLTVQLICGRMKARKFGLRYSLKSLGLRLQTTSFAVASLGIAMSMMIGITLMIESFRQTLVVWVDATIQADVYVSPASWRGKGAESYLEPEIVRALAARSEVRWADRLRGQLAYSGDRRVALAGVDMGPPDDVVRFRLLEGEREEAFRQVRDEGAVLVGETLARKLDRWTGQALTLYTANGEVQFPIAGVYYDYSTEGGAAILDLATMSRHFGAGEVNSVALYLRENVDTEAVSDALREAFDDAPLIIRSNRILRRQIFRIFDQTFAITRILQGMSLLIATAGVTLMLLVLARERVSELALYRAVGATRRQVFGVFVGKGLGMGLMGLTMGLVGGIVLAAILIFVINRAYFGWTIQPTWPWALMLQQSATILGAAVLASLYPALKASRTTAMELSREA